MSKRFAAVTVAVALAWQIGPASAGPCDNDTLARQAKAEPAIEVIEADVAVVQVKAETVVEPLALGAPVRPAQLQPFAVYFKGNGICPSDGFGISGGVFVMEVQGITVGCKATSFGSIELPRCFFKNPFGKIIPCKNKDVCYFQSVVVGLRGSPCPLYALGMDCR